MHAILTYFLITVEVICSIMLLGVILVQRSKSQGVGLAFGGAMGESIFGAQMGNVLTRTTVVLAVIFLLTTTFLAMLGARDTGPSSVVDGAPAPMAVPGVPDGMGGPAGQGGPMDGVSDDVGPMDAGAVDSVPISSVPMSSVPMQSAPVESTAVPVEAAPVDSGSGAAGGADVDAPVPPAAPAPAE